MAIDFSGLVIEHSTTTWVDVAFAVLITICIMITLTIKIFRDLRYLKDDDQYIP